MTMCGGRGVGDAGAYIYMAQSWAEAPPVMVMVPPRPPLWDGWGGRG